MTIICFGYKLIQFSFSSCLNITDIANRA